MTSAPTVFLPPLPRLLTTRVAVAFILLCALTLAGEAGQLQAAEKVWHRKPVVGGVTREYDAPAQNWLPGHRGVDLAAPDGATIRASAGGIVHFSGNVAGTPVVSIMHADGIRTTYQPVKTTLKRGMPVSKGDPIGVLARHGEHDGLHWGARRGEVYLNPMSLLRPRQVRLVPPRILDG